MEQEKLSKRMKCLFSEMLLVFRNFKPISLKDDILSVPRDYKKLQFKKNLLDSGADIFFVFLSFLLMATNTLVANGYSYFGIIVFLIYNSQGILYDLLKSVSTLLESGCNLLHQDYVLIRGGEILEHVSKKVYSTTTKFLRLKTNEEITNSLGRYLSALWQAKTIFPFYVFNVLSVIVLLVMTVITNVTIPQKIFIPLIISIFLIELISSTFSFIEDKNHWAKRRDLQDKKDIMMNDIVRVPPIISKDVKSRIMRLRNLAHQNYENEQDLIKKKNKVTMITTGIDTILLYVIIILYIVNAGAFTTETIVNLMATLAIFKTAQDRIRNLIRIFYSYSTGIIGIEKEEKNVEAIIAKYYEMIEKESQRLETRVCLTPFELMYQEKSDNDKPFQLILKRNLQFKLGDTIFLGGPSGSGKSTFIKLLTGNIIVDKKSHVKLENFNHLFYDESLRFGSKSLYDELFCIDHLNKTIPNLEKMQSILYHLHLWQEIEENCHNIWRWLKESTYECSLSNGQRQRLIIAKILYWLDESVDIVALDECTSGLDTSSSSDTCCASAESVLKYIIDFCNRDRKRLVVVSSHQEIHSLCKHELYFERNHGKTIIQISR